MKRPNLIRAGLYIALGVLLLWVAYTRYEGFIVNGVRSILGWAALLVAAALFYFWLAFRGLKKP